MNKDQEDKEFEKYLEKIEDPNYQGEINHALPENPTPLQVAKFNICQSILAYQQDNSLSDEKLAEKINLSQAETKEILFCHIDNFTLDRLMIYGNYLFSPGQVKVRVEREKIGNKAKVD